jgi:hypothetical protein
VEPPERRIEKKLVTVAVQVWLAGLEVDQLPVSYLVNASTNGRVLDLDPKFLRIRRRPSGKKFVKLAGCPRTAE